MAHMQSASTGCHSTELLCNDCLRNLPDDPSARPDPEVLACGAAGRGSARPARAERRDARTGNLAGLALSPLLLAALGWRALFYVFGAVGAPLLALWLAVVPARPTRARPDPAHGRARCGVLDLLRSRATWAIIVRRPARLVKSQ
jgi:hypothetical protein